LREREREKHREREREREIEMGLEQTTTWAVATVCTIFVVASLLVEAGINQLGKVSWLVSVSVCLSRLLEQIHQPREW
jgi:preprotein translocase subunit SecF